MLDPESDHSHLILTSTSESAGRVDTPLSYHSRQETQGSGSHLDSGSGLGLRKRIVMNPPPSFIQYAASIQPLTPQANGPMMINSNGQAVLLSPNSSPPNQVQADPQSQAQNVQPESSIKDGNDNSPQSSTADQQTKIDDGQVVLKGDKVVLVAPTETNTPTTTIPPTATPTAAEVITTVFTTSDLASNTAIASSSAVTQTSMAPTSTATSSYSTTASTTSASVTSSTTSSIPSSTSTSITSSSTPAPTSTNSSSAHHPPSAGIIFVIILLSLAIFIALASLFRYLVKSRRMTFLPCFRRSRDDDDDDGLSDLVRGFDTPRTLGGGGYNPYLHAGNYPQMEEISHSREQSELERRSSLFAHQSQNQRQSNNSPFLHSQVNSPNPASTDHGFGFDVPDLPMPPAALLHHQRDREDLPHSSLPHHLLGETGPLEVRNALPGEVDGQDHIDNHHDSNVRGIQGLVGLGLGEGSPRFLGVDGHGLPVPWSTPLPPRPSSIDSFDNHQSNPNPFGSSSTLTTMAAPPLGFPSPSLSHDSLSLPQRSATWASNLRNTLYNAISAARAPTLGSLAANNPMMEEDKFTRTVGNVYRNSSNRRKGIPVFDLEKGNFNEGGLKVVDEKDDPFTTREIPPVHRGSNSESASSDLNRISSDSSDETTSTLVVPRRLGPGGAAERFKGYYARSKSSTNVSASGEGGASEDGEASEVEDIRPPTRMAGGARAAGARTGSFVIV